MAVDLLILAAGAGRRFGGNKLLAFWRGRPLLETLLDNAAGAHVDSINLVLGRYATELEAHLQSLATAEIKRFVYSDWQLGMGNSLAFGVAQLPLHNAVLVLLADQPLIEAADLQKILESGRANPDRIICAEFSGTRAVPALFPPQYKNQLKILSGDRGAQALLSAPDVIALPLANAAFDVDFPADLAE